MLNNDLEKNNSFIKYKVSSEEKYIEAFLKENGFKVKCQKVLKNKLQSDSKPGKRIADFYLPRFDVYVEYFGMYNSTREIRNAYDFKANLYIKNSIPTIFLYPHELGFLDYAFHVKMIKLLKINKFYKRNRLFRYRLNRYINRKGVLALLMIIVGFGYFLGYFIYKDFGIRLAMVALYIGLLGCIASMLAIKHHFYKDNY